MITTIGIDADDTLWHNETIFESTHQKYKDLLSRYHDPETVEETLYATEMRNLELFGYGIKGFTLSSIETAIQLTKGEISADEIKTILDFAKNMLKHPVELLDGVSETLHTLSAQYELIVITKGDLRDQERKLSQSGLKQYFKHCEIVSDKTTSTYGRILSRYKIAPENFLMAGNSLKSDIIPVLEIGGTGVYLPYPLTWAHEKPNLPPENHKRFYQLENIRELPELITTLLKAD